MYSLVAVELVYPARVDFEIFEIHAWKQIRLQCKPRSRCATLDSCSLFFIRFSASR